MRDRDVRSELHRQLNTEHRGDPTTRILDELGLRHGASRVDVAVVNGTLHGYEIKSDSDTLERLASQVRVYTSVLDLATLVVGKKLAQRARKRVPKWWGIKIATEDAKTGTILEDERLPTPNEKIDPIALAELLWRTEAMELLAARGASPKLLRSPRAILYRELALQLSLDQLRSVVRERLKMRKSWRDPKLPSICVGSSQPRPMC
jgi:hypothetical protein